MRSGKIKLSYSCWSYIYYIRIYTEPPASKILISHITTNVYHFYVIVTLYTNFYSQYEAINMCCWLDTKYKRYLITRNCSKTISFCSLNYKNEGKQNRASWVFVTKQCFISCLTRCTSIEWVENHWVLLQNILLYTYYQSTDIIPWAF